MRKEHKTPGASKALPSPLRTLIVDDSALFLVCLRRLLDTEAWVQVVGMADSGREALLKAEELAPDLVLMDLHMPDLDGLQATALLRRHLPDIRIIIMTLNDTVASQAAARAHGAHGFVGKTRITGSLMVEIQRVFLRNESADERGTP